MSTPHPVRRLLVGSVGLHEAMAASLGLNATDLRCLELLVGEQEPTPSRLADLSGLTTGAVTGVLDRLEEAGFVRRESDPADRRRIVVRVVDARMSEVAAAFEPLIAALRSADGVTQASISTLAAAVDGAAERLRVEVQGGMLGDAYMAPLSDVARARLVIATGAPRINVGAARFGQQVRLVAEAAATRVRLGPAPGRQELIRATFDGPPPAIRSTDGSISMRYRRGMLDTRSREINARLAASVSWSIEVEGGLTDLDADLRDVPFDSLDVRGGANHVRVQLSRPSGTVRVRIEGGSSQVRIVRPRGVPLAVVSRDDISHLRFDGERRGSVAGGQRLASERYDSTPDRYAIELGGGVSDLRISTS
jgi:DNA-binding MarR family transcriptional regulator